jgi:lipopolysaccharide export LptBFGC system permease protein LptF
MEQVMLILTFVGTIATVISTIIAVKAKNEAQKILKEINNQRDKNVNNSGNIDIKNSGVNTGVISGINTGEVNSYAKK